MAAVAVVEVEAVEEAVAAGPVQGKFCLPVFHPFYLDRLGPILGARLALSST